MNKIFVVLGIKALASVLDGYKTYVGGGCLMLLGIGKIGYGAIGIAGGMFPDIALQYSFPATDTDTAMGLMQAGAAMFAAGIAACGIGHKIEKGAANV